MSLLALRKLGLRRGAQWVLQDIDLQVEPGEFIGLLGPNGAGKTSLLRAALGVLPAQGHSSLAALPLAARARAAAFLPQSREIAWPVPVGELVALGRSGQGPVGGDDPVVLRALAAMGLGDLAQRPATALSGGEQARVLIARALAQDTPLLMADEPVAGLDPEAQIRTMQVFADLARQGRAVVASIHDLGLAGRYCSRLVLLNQGRIIADGLPEQVLQPVLMAQVFGIHAYRAQTPDGLVFQPMGVVR